MLNTFKDDKEFIENKYHKTNEAFDAYQRMAYHGYDYPDTGLSDKEILSKLDSLAKKNENASHCIAKAEAVRLVLENTKIDVNEHDWFAGIYSVNRLILKTTCSKWKKEVSTNDIAETNAVLKDINDAALITAWPDFDHVVPDWEAVLSLGFKGIKDRAAQYKKMHEKEGTLTDEKKAFFDAIDIEYSAIIGLISRMYDYASSQNHPKAKLQAKCLKNIISGAPKDIYEAMQVIYIYFMVSECVDAYQVRSLGEGLDNSLYKFYADDIKNKTYSREQIKELLAYFLMQWSAIGNFWGQPFYIGGTKENGENRVNDLTYDILDVYDGLKIYNPKIQIKVNYNTPDKLLYKAFDMVRRGVSSIVFCCEPNMIKAVMNYGATYKEALEANITGCYETAVKGDETNTAAGYINLAKAVEYVFTNGYENKIKKQLGVKTGSLNELKTFEDFYAAVICQLDNIIKTAIDTANSFEKYLAKINPSVMYSATIKTSLKKGADAYGGAVKYNNSEILCLSFASFTDAVMAVKEFVYDKKHLSLEEYKNILDNNYEGHEKFLSMVLNSKHKFGNNDFETDMYARAAAKYITSKINNQKNAKGGVYKTELHSAMAFVWQGEKSPATADGRRAGAEFSKNISPVAGMDKNGVTALINSATAVDMTDFTSSACLDVMLHPSSVAGDEGYVCWKALLDTYMKKGGLCIQFNVFNKDMLRDAQKNPQKYKNLQVRVCGWNVLWNNLSKKEQDAYILRAENLQEG